MVAKRARIAQTFRLVRLEARQTETDHHNMGVTKIKCKVSQLDTVMWADLASESIVSSPIFMTKKNGQKTFHNGSKPNQASLR